MPPGAVTPDGSPAGALRVTSVATCRLPAGTATETATFWELVTDSVWAAPAPKAAVTWVTCEPELGGLEEPGEPGGVVEDDPLPAAANRVPLNALRGGLDVSLKVATAQPCWYAWGETSSHAEPVHHSIWVPPFN
jgi:hypothetical protein